MMNDLLIVSAIIVVAMVAQAFYLAGKINLNKK